MKKKLIAMVVAGAVMFVGTAGVASAKAPAGGCAQKSTGDCKRP